MLAPGRANGFGTSGGLLQAVKAGPPWVETMAISARLLSAAASAGQGNDHRGTPGVSLSSGGTVTEQVIEHQEN